MSVIGEFTIPAESFALDHALAADPAMTVRADRLASHSAMEVLPFLWATGGDLDAFQRTLSDDPSTTEVTVADETDGGTLYRMEWTDEFRELINTMVDHHAAITDASGRDGTWTLRLRFAEEGMVSAFQTHFREAGVQFEVEQLTRPKEPRQREFGLTERQYEALVAAVDEGYYEIPRTTSVEELGEVLDISANSVSQRLRRGSEVLVRNTLRTDEDDGAA